MLLPAAAFWNVYTVTGMAVIGSVSMVPLTMVYCLGSLALADPNLEDASRSAGAGPFRTLITVTVPMLVPAILSSAMLNLTASIEMLAVPMIFGEPAKIEFMTTYIYTKAFGGLEPNQGLVGASAMMLLVLVLAAGLPAEPPAAQPEEIHQRRRQGEPPAPHRPWPPALAALPAGRGLSADLRGPADRGAGAALSGQLPDADGAVSGRSSRSPITGTS